MDPGQGARRAPVRVALAIDGETAERTFAAKGISHDGPAIDEWREPLDEGPRHVRIELQTGADAQPLVWEGTIQAAPRRIHVISYTPQSGFQPSN